MSKPRRIRTPLPKGKTSQTRFKRRKNARVQVMFSQGPHIDALDLSKTKRLIKRLRPGDAYVVEGPFQKVLQLAIEGNRNEALTEIESQIRRQYGSNIPANIVRETALEELTKIEQRYIQSRMQPADWDIKRSEYELGQTLRARGIQLSVEGLTQDEFSHLLPKIQMWTTLLNEGEYWLQQRKFNLAFNRYGQSLEALADATQFRDHLLKQRLQKEIRERLQSPQKRKHRILVSWGESHSQIVSDLQEVYQKEPSVRIEQEKPFPKSTPLNPQMEVVQKFMRRESVTPQDIVRAFVGTEIEFQLIQRGYKNRKLVREIAIKASQLIQEPLLRRWVEQGYSGQRLDDQMLTHLQEQSIIRKTRL